eukprot:gene17297-17487_t
MLKIHNASVYFTARGGGAVKALDRVSLDIPASEIVVALGASGCGKSTLLNAIAGFLPLSEGTITLDGNPKFVQLREDIRGLIHQPEKPAQETRILSHAEFEAETTASPRIVSMNATAPGGGKTGLISAATIVVLLGIWWLATYFRLATPLFLPRPAEVLEQFIAVFQDGYANASLWEHVSASLARISVAAGIALVSGIPIGLAMGLNRWAKGIFDPPIEFYWPLPPLAYLPLMIIWLGIGEVSKISLLTLAMFAPICLSAQAGVRSVPLERINAALSLGASRWQLFRHIVFPSALPEILTGLRIAMGVGWGTLVAAELIASTRGIGFMIMSASHFLATDVVFVGIAIIAAWAFVFSYAIRLLESVLVPWKGRG